MLKTLSAEVERLPWGGLAGPSGGIRLPAKRSCAMSLSRREICQLIPPALLTALVTKAEGQSDPPADMPSAMFPFHKLPLHTSSTSAIRSVLKGNLATGESIEVHETTLPPGAAPHPPHHHPHSEMWLIREGTLEFTVNGKTDRIGPGSVGYASSNEEHGVRNPGTTPVTYFVVAIG